MRKSLLFGLLALILISALLISGCDKTATTPATAPAQTQASTPNATAPAAQTSAAQPTAAQPAASTGPKKGGTFISLVDRSPAGNIGWPAETFTMVPQYYLYNSLVKSWWNGDITAELATSWDVDPSAPAITFHLRQGVKFHDGTDFNAEAVKFNFDSMIAAKKRADWKSVDVIDQYTVRLNLTNWRNTILSSIDGNPIVSPTAVQKNGKEWIKLNPVGTGPFTFVEFIQDDHMTLKRNPNYWDPGLPYFETIELLYVPDYVTRKAAMQKKEADQTLVEFGKEAADFANMKDIQLFVQPQATAYMVFDDKNPDSPFYKKEVREAVDYALNRQWLADNLGYGYWQPCYQLQPRNNSAYNPNYKGRVYDQAKAKQLLADAGYPNGFDTLLLPNPTSLNKDLWVAVQSQLTQVGIRAEVKFLDVAKFDEYRNTGTWKNAILGDNMPAYGNMNQSIVQNFDPGAEFYQSMNKSRPDFVAALDAATKSVDYDAALTQKAFELLYANASVIPVAEGGRGYIYQSWLKDGGFGERGAYFWAWDWEHAWLDK